MLTVDYDRLGVRAGERVLDLGCGAGRHAFEAHRRGAHVVAVDLDVAELSGAKEVLDAMTEKGEAPPNALGGAARSWSRSTSTTASSRAPRKCSTR